MFPRRPPPKRIGRLDFLVWGSPFGACLRVIMPFMGQAAILPNDRAFEALRGGRVLVASFRMGKLEEALEYDYRVQSDTHEALTGLLDMTFKTEAEIAADPSCLPDQDLVRLNSVGELFKTFYGRLEWLQAGWLYACRRRREIMVDGISKLSENATATLPTTISRTFRWSRNWRRSPSTALRSPTVIMASRLFFATERKLAKQLRG